MRTARPSAAPASASTPAALPLYRDERPNPRRDVMLRCVALAAQSISPQELPRLVGTVIPSGWGRGEWKVLSGGDLHYALKGDLAPLNTQAGVGMPESGPGTNPRAGKILLNQLTIEMPPMVADAYVTAWVDYETAVVFRRAEDLNLTVEVWEVPWHRDPVLLPSIQPLLDAYDCSDPRLQSLLRGPAVPAVRHLVNWGDILRFAIFKRGNRKAGLATLFQCVDEQQKLIADHRAKLLPEHRGELGAAIISEVDYLGDCARKARLKWQEGKLLPDEVVSLLESRDEIHSMLQTGMDMGIVKEEVEEIDVLLRPLAEVPEFRAAAQGSIRLDMARGDAPCEYWGCDDTPDDFSDEEVENA